MQYARSRGWRALFAGLKPSVIGTATSQGIYFYVYSWLRQMAVVSTHDADLRAVQHPHHQQQHGCPGACTCIDEAKGMIQPGTQHHPARMPACHVLLQI
jgi:hypothetical protein